jgi:hypothetical protein
MRRQVEDVFSVLFPYNIDCLRRDRQAQVIIYALNEITAQTFGQCFEDLYATPFP